MIIHDGSFQLPKKMQMSDLPLSNYAEEYGVILNKQGKSVLYITCNHARCEVAKVMNNPPSIDDVSIQCLKKSSN